MTMSPEEFHQRYAAAVADEPARPPVEHDVAVARGRHLLRRRRIAVGVGACLAVVAIIGGSAIALRSAGDRNSDDPVTPAVSPTPSPSDPNRVEEERLLDQCRTGELQDPANAEKFFSSGTPLVKVVASSPFDTSAALESADGRYWAWCRITPAHPETDGMDVYRSAGDRGMSFFYYGGLGCPEESDQVGCTKFMMRWTERVSPRVATVEIVMGNGETVRLDGNDGYFVLEYVGELPSDVSPTRSGDLPGSFRTFLGLTYLDANGVPIAAGGGIGARRPGVPPLAKFPFLGTQPRVAT